MLFGVRTKVFALALLVAHASVMHASVVHAQAVPPAAAIDTAGGNLRVFLDCQGGGQGCSLDYFVLELPFVNWTRDRLFADVHVIVSFLTTGAGGNALTMTFLGQNRFTGRSDTLVTTTPPAATEDDVRRAIAMELRIGLLPYLVRTSQRSSFSVSYAGKQDGQASARSLKDPWNLWTFETSFNGFFSGESRQSFQNFWASAEARRVTGNWKLIFGTDGDYNQSQFTLQDGREFTNILRGNNTRARIVKSVTEHWSTGGVGRVGRSDFQNQEIAWAAAPVVEYNVFSWKQAASKQLTIAYAPGVYGFVYRDTTIFNRSEEIRPAHVLSASLNTRLRWGSVDLRARAFQFLHDTEKRNLAIGGNMQIRLFKGFSLQWDGEIAQVRDQLFLRKSGLSNEEILARQSALSTAYRYVAFFGLNYTFGSIYNTIVNPRLDRFQIVRN